MTLRELEYFVAVIDEGSFTRAAARLHVAQPSLSQQVRALEAELGGALIERLPRAVRLTAAGRALLPHARAAVLAAQRAGRAARTALNLEGGTIEIATVRSLVVELLPDSIKRWHELYPDTQIELREFSHRGALAEAVRSGVGDIAIGPRPERWKGPITPLGWQELVVVLPSDDELASHERPLDLALLADREWVLLEEHHGITEITAFACARAGFQPRGVVRTSQVDAAARLAAAGLGPTMLPKGNVPASLDAAVLRLDPSPGYEVTAYTRREWSPLASAYLQVLQATGVPERPENAEVIV